MLLALVGTVGSAASVAAGIIAVPETGGASLVLSAFALVSLAFSAADLQQYWNDIYVGKEGSEYKYGTENTSYNIIYDGLFKGDVDAYNTVRSVADAGTLIFGFGLAYIKNINNPAKNIKDVAGKNNVPKNSTSPENPEDFNPLENIEYTEKVLEQMKQGDYHSFPESVDAFGADGKTTTIVGGDGITRTKIEISGSYMGKDGTFEYIIEPDGKTVNHRLFVPN